MMLCSEGIGLLMSRHPDAWPALGPVEERMREYMWHRIWEELSTNKRCNRPVEFVPTRPRDFIIAASAYGTEGCKKRE